MKCDELCAEIYLMGRWFYDSKKVHDAIEELKDCKDEWAKQCTRLTAENAELKAIIAELEKSQRWRKYRDELPTEDMEGEGFLVSNGQYSVVCEWRGYWNNDPFCGDYNCEDVKYWLPLPKAPEVK